MPLKKSLPKKIFLSLSYLLCFVFLIVLTLPWLLSTKPGISVLSSFLNQSGSVQMSALSLSWRGPQKIEDLKYTEENGTLTFSCAKIECESSLIKILLPSHDIGLVTLQNPKAVIKQTVAAKPRQEKPQIKSAALFGSININEYIPRLTFPFLGKLEIKEGEITILSKDLDPITFTSLNGQLLSESSLSEIKLHLTGNTKQTSGTGSLLIDASFLKMDSLERSLTAQIDLKNFPMDGLDQIIALKFPAYRSLLTKAAGASIHFTSFLDFSKDQIKANIDAQSETLQMHLETGFNGESITLLSPALMQLKITPDLSQKIKELFPSSASFTSTSPIQISCQIDSLSIPKKETTFKFEETAFNAKLEVTPYQTASQFQIGCKANLSSQNLSLDTLGQVQFSLQNKASTSNSILSLSIQKPLDQTREILATLEIGKMPASFLDTFLSPSLSSLIGSSIEGTVTCKGTMNHLFCAPSLITPLLKIENGVFLLQDKTISLTHPLQVSYLANPLTLENLFGKETFSLNTETTITGTFSELSILDFSHLEKTNLQAEIKTPSLSFAKLSTLQNYTLQNLSCSIQAHSLAKMELNIQSDQIKLNWTGGFDPRERTLFWDKPLQIQALLTDPLLQSVLPKDTNCHLTQNTNLDIQIDPSAISLVLGFDQVKTSGKLSTKQISFEKITLENFQANFQILGVKDAASLSFSGQLVTPSLPAGTISGLANFDHLSSDLLFKTSLKLQDFPLLFIDTLLPHSSPISPILGSSINLQLAIEKSPKETSCQILGQSPFLELKGSLISNVQGIFLNPKNPLDIQFTLTPGAYLILQKGPKLFTLDKQTEIRASISKLQVPFISAPSFTISALDLSNLVLEANLQNNQIVFNRKQSEEKISLEKTSLSLQKKDLASPLSLLLDTTTNSSLSSKQGSVHIEATVQKLLSATKNLDLSQIHTDLTASFRNFPSPILDIAFPAKDKSLQPFSMLFGPSLDCQIKASLENNSGPIRLKLSSNNTTASLNGALTAGVLTLQENIQAQMKVTPETSKLFLKEVNPLSLKSISALTPFSLEIGAKGFSFPLSSFALNQIEIPNVKLNLGKVFCQNEGNVNTMLGLLKSKQLSQKKQLELWFAPIDLHIIHGILDLERTEILISDTYDIALWGKANLPGNQVNMTLGLTASCLKQAFGIKDLPSSYVMQIPLTGTLDHIELSTGQASAKIVALTLWQSKTGGVAGGVFGSVLNKALAPPGNESSTPPAKTPFPWQTSSKGY